MSLEGGEEMKKNVGDLDSRIRIRVGLILILVGILGLIDFNWLEMNLILAIILIAIGVISFVTGSTRSCGVYSLFGVNTCPPEE